MAANINKISLCAIYMYVHIYFCLGEYLCMYVYIFKHLIDCECFPLFPELSDYFIYHTYMYMHACKCVCVCERAHHLLVFTITINAY